MAWIPRLTRRLRLLARLDSVEASMAREMRAHIEFETAARMAAGATPDEARTGALRDFGSVEAFKEAGRDARGTRLAEDFFRDVAHGARMFIRERVFSLSAIATFALGIGAATAIFSVVYGVLLRPLPYADPAALVTLWEQNPARGLDRNVVSVPAFEAWRERTTAFESMAAMVPAPVTLPAADGPERVVGAEVSPGFFRLLGASPLLGREFTDEDARGAVVMISESFWRTHFGADPDIIGKALVLEGRPHHDGAPHEIVGVMPAGFEPPVFGWMAPGQPLWVPLLPDEDNRRYGRYLLVVARLRSGATLSAARDEMTAVAARLAIERPDHQGWSASVATLSDAITGDVRDALLYILAAVGLLLVLTVANVSMLLLVRTRRRLHELGLRRALGASDGRISRQLLTECLLIGGAGCVAGVLVAYPLVTWLVTLMPTDIPRGSEVRLDPQVLALASAAGLAASLIIGALAAARGRRAPSQLLREAPSRGAARASGRALVVAEVACGLVVAVLAGLVIRSFINLRSVELGFDPKGVVAARVAVGTAYQSVEAQRAFFTELVRRVGELPGIEAAGVISGRPFGGIGPRTAVRDSRVLATPTDLIADGRWVDRSALGALGVRLVAGAGFDGTDRPDGPVRVIINESLKQAVWPGRSAIGERLAIELNGGLDATVIGVVEDMRLFDPRTPARPGFFLSLDRFGGQAYDIVARAGTGPATAVPGVRAALADLDATLPLHRVRVLEHAVDASLAQDRFTAGLLSVFAALALVLASVGIYGVFAVEVAARRKELGVRLALGARPARLMASVIARALTSALLGIAIGAGLAVLLARAMQSILHGVEATDPWSFGAAVGCLLAVTIAATLVPAVQATRVSPLLILRGE